MQLLESRRVKRRPRWRKFILPALLALLGITAWKAWAPLSIRYRMWKQDRALQQARAFIEQRDAPNAQLALDVAINAVPGRPETYRVAADMLEQASAPQAMRLRRAVVQLLPNSPEDTAALVLSCLRFRDFNAAKDALSNTPPAIAATTPMLRAALSYALATDNAPVADALYNQLRSQFPNDDDLKFSQALLRLRHPRDDRREAAHRELEELAARNPARAPAIHREFAGYALQRNNYTDAKKWLGLVLAGPGATFSDRLQQANIELLVDHQPFEPIYARLAPLAGASEVDAAQFAQWLLIQNRTAETTRWFATLPEALRQTPGLKTVQADIAAQAQDWDQLASLLETGAWGPISKDTLRLAFAARTIDTPSRPSLRRETWDLTLNASGGNLSTLRILHRLATVWRWPDEAERTLWSIARTFPDQTWAHQTLFNAYREKKNTGGMREVMAALREADGSVPRYQHDWALLTLLVEPTSNWNPAKETMRGLYTGDPTNATYATGYAFALALSGKGEDALAVIQKLTPAERDYPPRQPYLAFVNGIARKADDFERCISLGADASYLPEENYLFVRGREALTRKPEKPKPAKPAADGGT